MQIGLRIDVDTWRGTRDGVPRLCRVLAQHGLHGTFFFSAGPDNMGRHLWRLLRPQFLLKMLRSNAPSLYGWDIVLRGTLWPGPLIGKGQAQVLRDTARAGHEIGLHAWDHHAWQMSVDRAGQERVHQWLQESFDTIAQAAGQPPVCAAAPAWRCTDTVLLEREKFPFRYNSDCRGTSVFQPVVSGQALQQLQIPATLPTYDEVIGRDGITNENYNDYLLSQLKPDALNVLTIHAEVEGIVCADLFEDFVARVIALGGELVPLGALREASAPGEDIPTARIVAETVPGREGWISVQGVA